MPGVAVSIIDPPPRQMNMLCSMSDPAGLETMAVIVRDIVLQTCSATLKDYQEEQQCYLVPEATFEKRDKVYRFRAQREDAPPNEKVSSKPVCVGVWQASCV